MKGIKYGLSTVILSVALVAASLVYAYIIQTNINLKKEIPIPEIEKKIDINERLEYSVEWLGIPSGMLTLAVEGVKKINGHDCYYIVACAKPNKFFAKFHNIEYTTRTYIDKVTFCSRRFEKLSIKRGKIHRESVDFKEGSQDILSGFYQFRFMKISPGGEYCIDVRHEGKNWPVRIKIEEPFLKEIRRKGELAVFQTCAAANLNLSILGQPKVFVFFSADKQRIPIEFKFRTKIGIIRGIIKNKQVQKISF